MKRRTLDIAFSVGGIVFSVLLLVVGIVLTSQKNFAEDYVRDQFEQQQIAFAPEENLRGEQDDAPCLVDYAGQPLLTGKQAECYANEYIAFHMGESAETAGFPGATYATLGGPEREARTALADAKEAGQPTDELQATYDSISNLRNTMFKGETLRGLLLTTYGFSIFGERAGQAAVVCFIAAAVLFLLSLAGLAHAAMTRKDETVFVAQVPANA